MLAAARQRLVLKPCALSISVLVPTLYMLPVRSFIGTASVMTAQLQPRAPFHPWLGHVEHAAELLALKRSKPHHPLAVLTDVIMSCLRGLGRASHCVHDPVEAVLQEPEEA